MKKFILAIAVVFVCTAVLSMGSGDAFLRVAHADNCVAKDNLKEKAKSFISRCRKGSINREYPGELLDKTLVEIKRGSSAKEKKAWNS